MFGGNGLCCFTNDTGGGSIRRKAYGAQWTTMRAFIFKFWDLFYFILRDLLFPEASGGS